MASRVQFGSVGKEIPIVRGLTRVKKNPLVRDLTKVKETEEAPSSIFL
jgi:hypothetical protein